MQSLNVDLPSIRNPEPNGPMTTRFQALIFATLFILSIVFWWRSLVATIKLALAVDAYTHILLILPLSAALIYMEWAHVHIAPRPSPRIGAALLLLAALIACCAKWIIVTAPDDVRLSFAMLALVIWWIASVLLCFGVKAFQSLLFPLCFLALLVPIPSFALSRIIEFLQQESALAARILFQLARVPVTQDGVVLSIPKLDIEVAQECSSIRSSALLVVTTLVLAHLFLRSWWRKLILVAAAIPLSVAKNGLRIFTIAELGTRVDPGFLHGRLHRQGGIIFFGLSVAGIIVLLWIFRRNDFRTSPERSAAD
jgi:exosortase